MTSPCEIISTEYEKNDTYGNGRVLASPCPFINPVTRFNTYCQTPTTSTKYDDACLQVLGGVQDSNGLAFNKFINQPPSEWPVNRINSGGNFLGTEGATFGDQVQLRSGGNTMAYVVLLQGPGKPAQTRMFFVTLDTLGFERIPEALVLGESTNVADDSVGFDVDLNGVIYFSHTYESNGEFKVQVYEFDPSKDLEPQVIVVIPTTRSYQGSLSVSGDGNYLAMEVINDSKTDVALVNLDSKTYVFPPELMDGGNTNFSRNFGLYVNDSAEICRVLFFSNPNILWYRGPGVVGTFNVESTDVFTNRMTRDGIMYGFPSTGAGGTLEKFSYDIIETEQVLAQGKFASSLAVDVNTNQIFIMTSTESQIITITSPDVILIPEPLVNFEVDQNVAFLGLTWNGQNQLVYSSMRNNINQFQVFDLDGTFQFLDRCWREGAFCGMK